MHRAELQKSTITGKSSFLNARRIIRRFELLGLAARLQRVTWSRCLRRRLTLESDAIFRGFEVAPKDIAQNGRGGAVQVCRVFRTVVRNVVEGAQPARAMF